MATSKDPFFSIIIPALNEEKYLPLLLEDYSKQTTDKFEIIVIDGNSTDLTVEKAKAFKDKLPSLTILSSDVRNVSYQRNMGARQAKGKYLLFNDADNRLPEYFLEGLKYHLHVKPVDLFTCWCIPDSENNSDKAIATYLNLLVESSYLIGNPAALGALIGCRRDIFDKIGGFDREVGFAEDTEFVRQGFKKGFSFSVIHEPRFVYSFRRFRKMGILKMLQKYAVLNLKYVTKQKVNQQKEYPMGGQMFGKGETPQFLNTIQNNIKKISRKPKLRDRISALLSLEEN